MALLLEDQGITFEDSAYKKSFLTTLYELCCSQEFTDVTLILKGKELRAHRLILSAASRVFSAMFQVDMKEKNEGNALNFI